MLQLYIDLLQGSCISQTRHNLLHYCARFVHKRPVMLVLHGDRKSHCACCFNTGAVDG